MEKLRVHHKNDWIIKGIVLSFINFSLIYISGAYYTPGLRILIQSYKEIGSDSTVFWELPA